MNKDVWAKIISVVTTPFLSAPLAALITIGVNAGSFGAFLRWGGLFFALSTMVPIVYIVHGVKTGRITDMHIMVRGQRTGPFMVAIAATVVLCVLYGVLHAPHVIQALGYSMLITGVVMMAIMRFWKVSVHAAAWTGGTIVLANLVSVYWLVLLGMVPIIIWARHRRGRHSYWQGITATVVVAVSLQVFLMAFGA